MHKPCLDLAIMSFAPSQCHYLIIFDKTQSTGMMVIPQVLDKHLQSDPIGFRYVEDMMLQDMVNKKSQLRLSLLWLKR